METPRVRTLVKCGYCEVYVDADEQLVCQDCEDRLTRDIALEAIYEHMLELGTVSNNNIKVLKERKDQLELIRPELDKLLNKMEEVDDSD